MAVGAWTIYPTAKPKMLNGTFDFDTHSYIAIPLSNAYSYNAAHATLADVVAAEVTNPGDGASLRKALANSSLTGTGTVVWDADDFVIGPTSSTVNIKHVAIFDDTAAADDLVGVFDTDTANANGVAVTQLTVALPNGIFGLT